MGIGVSVFLIAVGAILAFATNLSVNEFDLDTVGVILMIVGLLGLVVTLLFWSDFSPYRRGRRDDVVVRDRDYVDRDVL